MQEVNHSTRRKWAAPLVLLAIVVIAGVGAALLFRGQDVHTEEGETPKKTLLLDGPVDELPVVDDFRWNVAASRSPLLAVLVWWLAVEIIGLLAWPLAFVVFGRFLERGYILAKSLGLLLVAYLVWLAASLRLLPNALPTILLALFLLALLSLYLLGRNGRQMWAFWRERWPLVAVSEAIFALAFLLFVGIRVLNPDLWQPWLGGEKMMEFAFLNAILKSAHFPPYDPYFAGGYVNYYYYGQFVVAVIIKLTGIEPAVAFNLAIPTLFALTAGNAFCVGYNLSLVEGAGRLVSGLLSSIMVAVLGNLASMAQIVRKLGDVGGLVFRSSIPGLEGLVRIGPGIIKVLGGHPLPPFDYWSPTRVIPFTINEFPFFSFLFADLHPHMINIPFTILVVALALNLLLRDKSRHRFPSRISQTELRSHTSREPTERTENAEQALTEVSGVWDDTAQSVKSVTQIRVGWFQEVDNQTLWTYAIIPLCLGALGVINTWDLPAYWGLMVCAFVLEQYLRAGRIRLASTAIFAGLMLVSSFILYWPFFAHYKALYVGLGLVQGRTALGLFVNIWGLFLFVIISFVLAELATGRARLGAWRFIRLILRRWTELPHFVELYRALVHGPQPSYLLILYLWGGGMVMVVGLILFGYWVLALLFFPLILAALLLPGREVSPRMIFVCLLILIGLLVLIGCELFYLKDFLGGGDYRRMNTLFKFYVQVWVILGLAGASALPHLWVSLWRRSSAPLSWAWSLFLALLLTASALYPLLGTGARVLDRFPGPRPPVGTLDGLAYMTVGSFAWPDENNRIELKYDYQAIRWLIENVKGTPVIAEASLSYYREGGMRVSSYTGLPTLLGFHQSEQRHAPQVGERDGQVRDFFNTPDVRRALELIGALRISYIYVGKLERAVYEAAGLTRFERMAEEGYLAVVFENEEVKIYQVIEAGHLSYGSLSPAPFARM